MDPYLSQKIVKGLRKIFRLLKMGDKSFIDYTGHGTSEHHSVSAKLPSVAQDQWVLRFEHTVDSTISTSNGDVNVFVGIADDPTKHFQEDQDWIGSRLMLSANSGGNYGLIRPNSCLLYTSDAADE